MRPLLLLTALTTLTLPAEETLSRLTFTGQTTISGTISQINPQENTLKLTSPFLKGQTTLKTDNLLKLSLNLKPQIPETDHHALATIAPHFEHPMQDTIRGRLVGVDDQTVTLDTWYAGQLKLKRSMVRGLNIYANSPSLYHGPNGLDDWISANGKPEENWTYKKGALISRTRSSIARKIELGERSKLSFRAQWREYPNFQITFLANSGKKNYPSIGYTLSAQRSSLNLNRNGPDQQRAQIFGESIQHLRNQESAVFDIYLDRSPEGKNALIIDGKLIKEWSGTDDNEKMGQWLILGNQTTSPIKFSNISVSLWSGNIPTNKQEDTEPEKELFQGQKGQRIDLANGDTLFGKITAVQKGQTAIETSHGNITIPVGRLRSFLLHPKNKEGEEPATTQEEPRMWPKDVRAWFTQGGYVTLRLTSLTDQKISGYSQVFGDAEFDLSAFSHIEFNIWNPDLDQERNGTHQDW